MIKILSIDIDGTTLNEKVAVTEETKEAISAAIDKGVIVVPNTGRTRKIIPEEVLNIPGIKYAITSNGAVIDDIETGETLYKEVIPKESYKEIFDSIKDNELFLTYFINGENYLPESSFKRLKEFIPEKFWDIFIENSNHVTDEQMQEIIENEPIEKIDFSARPNEPEKINEIIAKLKEIPELEILFQDTEANGEITSINANKGSALATLANKLGVDCSQVMAVGDGINDISMLTFAETGVAMGQASDKVKSAAKYQTDSNSANGLAKAIKKFILDKEDSEDIPSEMIKRIKNASN